MAIVSTDLCELLDEVLDSSFTAPVDVKNFFDSRSKVEPDFFEECASTVSLGRPKKEKSAEAKEARKKYVAAASRKSRAKRKMELQKMQVRAEELELEQEDFMKIIAELQNEIQTLKRSRETLGHSSLENENKLLRAEVKRHKVFIDELSVCLNKHPSFTLEEKIRLASTGVDSAIGQMMGLAANSILDNWETKLVQFPADIPNHGSTAELKYQYLPYGASRNEAKRVNFRLDLHNVPGNAKKMAEKTWLMVNTEEFFTEEMAHLFPETKCEWTPVSNFFQDSSESSEKGNHEFIWDEGRNRMSIWKYSEESLKGDKNKFFSPCTTAYREMELDRFIFPGPSSKERSTKEKNDSLRGYLLCTTMAHSSIYKFLPDSPDFKRIRSSSYEGTVILEGDDSSKCTFSYICSTPVERGNCTYYDPEASLPVDEHGNINPNFFEYIKTTMNWLMQFSQDE
mmetsp:Transcript_11168/g.14552  ORF Transcript_11168/g.14552 Transcript_11168/m.14552 type:complete len:455 (+) Transcript_11168:86-1450(+)